MKSIVIFGLIAFFLFSCQYNPCGSNEDICSSVYVQLYDFPETPQKAQLYIYHKDNGFTRPEIEKKPSGESRIDTASFTIKKLEKEHILYSIPYNEEEYFKKKEYTAFTFSHPFSKNKDYRIVINDSLFFDISDLVYDVRIDSAHWTTKGPVKSCVIFGMKVNGTLLDEEYLFANYFLLPYSMCKIVHQ